mmetsp:Transcript_59959/g.139680  ORF Transcript_59959/g.139680 Transcript_59959/m.139680 type:complete len:294 (+) Transcript_59959:1-882(+)
MRPLSDSLLPVSEAKEAKPRTIPARVLAAIGAGSAGLLSAAGLFLVGAAFGRATPHDHAASSVSLRALNGTGAAALAAGLNADCYKFTGGTCHVSDCDPDRGAECSAGYCLCATGCTGANGVCYPTTYPVAAAGFTLTNKKYDWQKLYMPATAPLDQLKTTAVPSFLNGDKDKFVLHQLPGEVAGHLDYFLTTVAFPEYVACIRATAGTAFSAFGAYEVGLYRQFAPQRLAVRVCSLGDGKIMIGSVGTTNTVWFYVHHGSWNVYGWSLGDPGDSGVWVTDPPIPEGMLPLCV